MTEEITKIGLAKQKSFLYYLVNKMFVLLNT